jgi:hypothetical protein
LVEETGVPGKNLLSHNVTSIGELSGGNKDTVDKYLLIWYFEARLKEHYSNFIKAIEVTRTLFIMFNVNRIITFLVTKSQIVYDKHIITCHFSNHTLYQPSFIYHPQFSGNSRSEHTDIDGKACNNIPEAVNKLALSARLDNSCETG